MLRFTGAFGVNTVGGAVVLAAALGVAESGAGAANDNRLLNNVDALKTVPASDQASAPVEALKAELATLWDWREQGRRPLNVEVVSSQKKNGFRVEGLYINGYGDERGQDRIFFYYARPEKGDGKYPAYIDVTGGSESDRSLWMAGGNTCAVLDIEWRGPKNTFRSKWAGGSFGTMKELTTLRDNSSFRLVCGVRRMLDFLAQQPEIDMEHVGIGGGSMGGYFTLLAAGVDERISFGMDELGAGFLADTPSRLGQIDLDPERKKVWLEAFDPYSYASRTKARIVMNLSANDYFFWLGDAAENFRALAGEKRICITPNFNHNDGAFGKKKNAASSWLAYGMGREPAYPQISSVRNEGAAYTATTGNDAEIQEAVLCWSPGGQVVWPARYWAEVPAVRTAGGWRAEVPSCYAGLARAAFMSVRDARGRMVSSVPALVAGAEPQTAEGPLWADGQLWDTAAGVAAWRLIGPNVRKGAEGATLSGEGPHGFAIRSRGAFALVSNSLVLSAGHAKAHRGLKLEVSGNGQPGEMAVTLVRRFGAAQGQQEFACTVKYGAAAQVCELTWPDFKSAAGDGGALFPFDSLRLDGTCKGGAAVSVRSIGFLE